MGTGVTSPGDDGDGGRHRLHPLIVDQGRVDLLELVEVTAYQDKRQSPTETVVGGDRKDHRGMGRQAQEWRHQRTAQAAPGHGNGSAGSSRTWETLNRPAVDTASPGMTNQGALRRRLGTEGAGRRTGPDRTGHETQRLQQGQPALAHFGQR